MSAHEIVVRDIEAGRYRGRMLETGDGPPVVILASMLVLGVAYVPTMKALAQRGFCVRVLELPGTGRAQRVKSAWTVDHYSEWVASFLAHEVRQPAIVIGHSNSGVVAMDMAVRAPQVVAGLVLADAIGADERRSLARIIAGRAWDAVLEARLTARGIWQPIYNLLIHRRNMLHQIGLSGWYDALELAKRIHVPTLLAWGARDHTTPPRCLEAYKKAMPAARVYLWRAGSHDWIVTHPGEFAAAVHDFSREVAPGGQWGGRPASLS